MKTAENAAVNFLRSTAALVVVMEHVRTLVFVDWVDASHTPASAVFYLVTGLGNSAVMIFFVLSGFWVGGSVIRSVGRNSFSWRNYLIRRGVRLWIVLVPAIVLALLLGALLLLLFGGSDIAAGSVAYHSVVPADLDRRLSLGVALGNLLFLQGILLPTVGVDGPLWSLAYEFWYYLLFPLLALLVTRRAVWTRLLCGIGVVAVCVIVGLPVLQYFPIWLMGAGVALALPRLQAWTSHRRPVVVALLRSASVLLLASALIWRREGGGSGLLGQYVVALGAVALLCTLVSDLRLTGRRWWWARAWAGYAESSYSLYVTHVPVAAFLVAWLLPSSSGRLRLDVGTLLLFLLSCAVLAGVGWLFASATEHRTERVRRLVDRLVPNGRVKAPTLVVQPGDVQQMKPPGRRADADGGA